MRFEQYVHQICGALGGAAGLPDAVEQLCHRLEVSRRRGRTLLTAGNGGSASTAEHAALDFNRRGALRCLPLTLNTGALTGSANDDGFERVFADAYRVTARAGDPVLIFTTSGNSPNLVALARHVRDRGAEVLSCTGGDGGLVGELSDLEVRVALSDPGMIESCHLALAHYCAEATASTASAYGNGARGSAASAARSASGPRV
jgi:D-sedoheptulose 7-phosphate isomerase